MEGEWLDLHALDFALLGRGSGRHLRNELRARTLFGRQSGGLLRNKTRAESNSVKVDQY